jgi:hypothetical protein
MATAYLMDACTTLCPSPHPVSCQVWVNAVLNNNRSDHTSYGNFNQELPAVGSRAKPLVYNRCAVCDSSPWLSSPPAPSPLATHGNGPPCVR